MSGVGGNYPKVNIGTLAHTGFAWETVEQSKGKYNFQTLDNYMAAMVAHGLVDPATNTANFAITLSAGTPPWAVADQSTCGNAACSAPPDNVQDWTDFVTAIVQHFNGKNQPHVKYYELWNEANVALWWTGTNAQLLALGQAAYPIVHQDPNSILLTPSVAGTTSVSTTWMTAYLQAGGYKYADGGAFHGYLGAQGNINPFPMPEQDQTSGCKPNAGCYGSIVTKATQMRAVFDQNGLAGKPMYQTEGSWGNGNVTDPATQVAWLARFNLLQAGLRSTLNLQMAAWFTWSPQAFGWGTITTPSLEPTTAGIAYSQVFNWVVGATIAQPCSSAPNGTWTCNLARPGGYVAQAVWNVNGSLAYTPGAPYAQYRDLTGVTTPMVAGTAVTIGANPILLEGTTTATPSISFVANAEGEVPLIAPNTWVEIKGFNLAPAGDSRVWKPADFLNNQMPKQLDGVSATVNGKAAYIYYISPTQVNILTPPDALQGPVSVQLTSTGTSATAAAIATESSMPSFFVFNGGPYVAAEHVDGSLLGPEILYPGTTTPAKPGETVVLYANGFGATTLPVVSGATTQSGVLTPLPAIAIGGVAANVVFAGLVAPGEFQFNVVIPASLADGDQPLVATLNGLSTQPLALITVHH